MTKGRERAVVALGMFDGVHVGHQRLLDVAQQEAARLRAVAAVYTFSNHPLSVLGGTPRLLTDAQTRRALLLAGGVAEVVMTPFDLALARSTPEAFLERLAAQWELAGVVAGYNYTFGDRASGTADTLRKLGQEHGFAVFIVPPVLLDGTPVSSTRIRRLIEEAGDVTIAGKLLGRPYRLSGDVIANRQNGRRFGYPTANIAVQPDAVLPLTGVYATRAHAGQRSWVAVTNVGTNPTVHGDHVSVETHLLDFAGDLYGQRLSVDFYERLRGEFAFESERALVARIAKDVETARQLLENRA